jgi:glycosyltransferase involved in cell wall biosynthesis
MSSISLVIPAYNESLLLPRLLDSVDVARERYVGGRDAVEVIVSDNGSTDDTASIAATRGCRVVPVAKRLIAAARNGGAQVATGELLCFVDADMQVHPETFNAISRTLTGDRFVGGSTGGRLERWSVGIALTYAALYPLIALLRMDTGVVFCRRDDFRIVGEYDESRPIGEDVAFLMALRRLGKKRRQRLIRLTEVRTIVSMRKFDQHGDWHFLRMLPTGVVALFRPSLATKIANKFWYTDDR